MTDDLAYLDATAQAELVRSGSLSPLELVDAAIVRIEKLNPELNAVIHPSFDKARAAASSADLPDGPFRGVPFLIKDILCTVAGEPYHDGMRFLKELNWTASVDSFLAQKFRSGGLISLGRTNAPELGILPTTEPVAYGPTRNPWNLEHSTGGSSGGSAAAVASGMVPIAHANDGGGSIRIPASECGLFGLKPSRGRTSLGPEFGDVQAGLVAEHVLTRSVRDSAAILDLVAGPMPGDPYFAPLPSRPFLSEVGADPGTLRIGLLSEAPGGAADVHPDCLAAIGEARALLESLGHVVEDSAPQGLEDPEYIAQFLTLWACGIAAAVDEWSVRTKRRIGKDDVEPLTWALAEMGRTYSGAQLLGAVGWLQAGARRIGMWFASGFDLLMTPTLAEPPPRLGEMASDPENPLQPIFRAAGVTPFTPLFNATGQPAVSLPLYWNTDGLPIGVQLAAPYGREDVLFRLSSQLEAARPWAERIPPVHA
jgi:amidase